MKIGIIGAENSHTRHYAKMINVDGLFPGYSVDYVWGEKREFAEQAAEVGQIPNIVDDTEAMLGKIDALIVDHRHAKYHLPAAEPYIEQGIPTFVDKPFCYRAEEGKAFLEKAQKHGAPVTSFSSVPFQEDYKKFQAEAAKLGTIISGTTHGSCKLENEYGGIFFYGIHQVEMALKAFGYNVDAALVSDDGKLPTASLIYDSGLTVTMALLQDGGPGFGLGAVGTEGAHYEDIAMDKVPYLNSTRTFLTMFETGEEPLTHEQLLRPVQVLEALDKSINSGTVERVAR